METLHKLKKISIACPVCKAKEIIEIPISIIDKSKQLTTISIPKGKICNHHFQLFIDKNYIVRGFQKVDFELCDKKTPNQKGIDLNSLNNDNRKNSVAVAATLQQNRKIMSLKEIYEEFWEFITDDNELFQKYIEEDKRRKEHLNNCQILDIQREILPKHVCKNLK